MRIGVAGGGSDYADHFARYGGAFVASAIEWRVHVLLHPLGPGSEQFVRASYARVEDVTRIQDIQHPTIRESLGVFPPERPIGIYTWSDVPARTGLGASSAFTVALLTALAASRGQHIAATDAAKLAIMVERQLCREVGGIQDQLVAAYGGLAHYSIETSGSIRRTELPSAAFVSLQELLGMVWLGVPSTRTEPRLEREESLALRQASAAGSLFEAVSGRHTMGAKIPSAAQIRAAFIEAILESDSAKVAPYGIPSTVSRVREACLDAGAHATKLAGSGGGGFLLVAIDRLRRQDLEAALQPLGLKPLFPALSKAGVSVQEVGMKSAVPLADSHP